MKAEERKELIKFVKANCDARKVDFRNMNDETLQLFADSLKRIDSVKRNAVNVKGIFEALGKKLLK